jgi:hypothetical protein
MRAGESEETLRLRAVAATCTHAAGYKLHACTLHAEPEAAFSRIFVAGSSNGGGRGRTPNGRGFRTSRPRGRPRDTRGTRSGLELGALGWPCCGTLWVFLTLHVCCMRAWCKFGNNRAETRRIKSALTLRTIGSAPALCRASSSLYVCAANKAARSASHRPPCASVLLPARARSGWLGHLFGKRRIGEQQLGHLTRLVVPVEREPYVDHLRRASRSIKKWRQRHRAMQQPATSA